MSEDSAEDRTTTMTPVFLWADDTLVGYCCDRCGGEISVKRAYEIDAGDRRCPECGSRILGWWNW